MFVRNTPAGAGNTPGAWPTWTPCREQADMDQFTPDGGHRPRTSTDRAGQRYGRLTVMRRSGRRTGNQGIWWLCQCDCGNETVVATAALNSGHTKSCGCSRKGPGPGRLPGEAAFNLVVRSYKDNARKRGLTWQLTDADFKRLASLDCFYCGAPPSLVSQTAPHSGQWIYNGIDRVDNSHGYALENVVTCCKICNHAKKDLSFDDFMAWIARLTEYHWSHPEITSSRLLAPVRTAR